MTDAKPKQHWYDKVSVNFNTLINLYAQTETIFFEILSPKARNARWSYGISADDATEFMRDVARFNKKHSQEVEASIVVEGTCEFKQLQRDYGWSSHGAAKESDGEADENSEPRAFLYVQTRLDEVLSGQKLKNAVDLFATLVYDPGSFGDFKEHLKDDHPLAAEAPTIVPSSATK